MQVILGWSAISTLAAWGVYRIDKAGAPRRLRNVTAGARRLRAAVVRNRLAAIDRGVQKRGSEMGQDDQVRPSENSTVTGADKRLRATAQRQGDAHYVERGCAVGAVIALLALAYVLAS